MPSAESVDAVTVDAFGTLVELTDPSERLRAALSERGVSRGRAAVERAFQAEVDYYVPRSLEGRDEDRLAALRRDCAAVFLAELGADLEPDEFAPAFVAALEFRVVPGARAALERLASAGFRLACVANWDYTLPEHLARLGLADRFAAIVTSAEAGVQKPDPAIFLRALARLGVDPWRALHVGDDEVDRAGARAAGLSFEPAPLATLPERLGLGR